MKKFLSMVMAAAMVVSLVPATAFAATSDDFKATAKVVNAQNYPVGDVDNPIVGPEVQLTFTTADWTASGSDLEFTFTLDNAKVEDGTAPAYADADGKVDGLSAVLRYDKGGTKTYDAVYEDTDEFTVTIPAADTRKMSRGDVLALKVSASGEGIVMDKQSKGKTAEVSVESDDVTITNGDNLVIASVEDKNIKVSVKDTVDIATEEVAKTKDIKIEPSVGSDFSAIYGTGTSKKGELKLKLNSGFEFDVDNTTKIVTGGAEFYLNSNAGVEVDDDEIIINVATITGNEVPGGTATTGLRTGGNVDVWTIKDLGIEAVSAKSGAVATVKVYATGCDTVSVEAAKVVDYTVSMTVDEDEDVPVIYSGVDVDNTGITDDSDHEALEVTLKETFAGAWNNSKDFTLSLPEGVYLADAISTSTDGDFTLRDQAAASPSTAEMQTWFEEAYNEGNYIDLTFERRTWDETNPDGPNDEPAEVSFTLTLVADPNFEGDVVLKLTGDAVDEQEVTIAKFVKPFTVEAQQNDMQIDYRNTEIPTSVVIKEAEAGLWAKDTTFTLALDKISFDDEGKITADEKSGLEVKDNELKHVRGTNGANDTLTFTIDSRSDDEPATVTISGLQLYMDRSLPAGAYDLDVYSTTMLHGTDGTPSTANTANKGFLDMKVFGADVDTSDDIYRISDINDDFYSETAKAGFVNIVTAGREDTDSFTTKVVVPVGESYLISGENKVEIPVPAYINAAGYTMLPLRAVAVALGINENNVLWDQSTRTATVMYGSKIINMTYGQKVVYVNAAPIPASTSVEIKENRMFLGLRDLGTALGVTDITWDGATKTATLNGNK